MKIIGLTGGIGTGKSTVAGFLGELGAATLDLDKVGHEALKKGSPARDQVISEFGSGILNADGNIDRSRLGKIVFNDSDALQRLNRITHPVIDAMVEDRLEKYREKDTAVVVLEAAAMLEAGRALQADEIWVTTAPETTVLERLGKKPGYSEADVKTRIRSQLTDEERIKHADVIIDTDCTLEELKDRVKTEWRKLLGRI